MKNERLRQLLDLRGNKQKFCIEDSEGNFVELVNGSAGTVHSVEKCIVAEIFGDEIEPEDDKRLETLLKLRYSDLSGEKTPRKAKKEAVKEQ